MTIILKAGIQFVAETAVEHLLKNAVDARHSEKIGVIDEQREFDRRMRIAQNVLGLVCPPAGKAMLVLEHGPIIAADGIMKAWDSEAAKCLGRWIKLRA